MPTPSPLTIAKVFWDVLEANIAKAKLEAAGLDCILADEKTVTMDWTLCNAIGGVKLLVHGDELVRAHAVLAENHAADFDAGGEPDDGPIPRRSAREQRAADAMGAAVLGVLMFPLSLYALWLALRALAGEGPLDGKGRRQAWGVLVLALPVLLVAVLLGVVLFSRV